jgi:hypothetical protein
MQLSFNFTFMIGGDEVFCCYTVPYTYTEVMVHLKEIKLLNDASPYKFCRQEKIGYSVAGIEIPILKVSNPNQDYEVEKRIWQK